MLVVLVVAAGAAWESPVLELIERNPFPGTPPKYLRASFYEYHFTDAEERKATGAWWKREYLGVYYPG